MFNLNAMQANLRSLSNKKDQACENRNNAWHTLQSLIKLNQPNINTLYAERYRTFNRANENFALAQLAYSRKDHKGARKFSKTAKKCMSLVRKIDKKRLVLVNKIKDAAAYNKIAGEQYRKINLEFKKTKRLCTAKRAQVMVIANNIPPQYRDNVSITEYENGAINIYFGGKGSPAGKGHGHVCIDPSGKVRYTRNPWSKHGSHNYVKQDKRPDKNNSR